MNILNYIGSRAPASRRGLTVAAATLLIAFSVVLAQAAEGTKIVRKEGGISPNPVVTGVSKGNGKINLQWQAFGSQVHRGSNAVFQVMKCPALKGAPSSWTPVATVTNGNSFSAAFDGEAAFFNVQQSPAPEYAGSDKCFLCHADTHDGWMTTAHAGAFQTLKNIKMDKNASCLPCHTVGYGTSGGFQDEATTPHLAGVQCENCHGPAGGHAAAPLNKYGIDQSKLPVKTLSAEMCGGCHTDAHHPTYDEWATSAHGTTTIPEEEFSDPATGPARMLTCGACHSAATRVALLNATLNNIAERGTPDPTNFNPEMPSPKEAGESTITCATCHELHGKNNPVQLRFPLKSTIPYSYSTATNFAANFNAEVQTCAQCHNMRGASWKGTSRPPHHSPQYNILIGSGGFDDNATTIPQGKHMEIENQCAQCHTHSHSPASVTEASPAYTGHDFKPTMVGCVECHGDEVAGELLTEAVQKNTKEQIAAVKALLDQWALTKAPDALKQKYGALAWEFQNVGQLSTLPKPGFTGPTAAEQAGVPDGIKQARHNLYMIEHDHSYGVHNGPYTRFLLKVARDKVNAALAAQ